MSLGNPLFTRARAVAFLLSLGVCVACGDKRSELDTESTSGQGPGTGGSGVGGFMSGGGADPCGNTCSDDLRQVLDCNGDVVMECPVHQGCGPGGCVPACESAALNKSTRGCDYYAVAPDIIDVGAGACFAAFVVNSWATPMTIEVERAGQVLDVSSFARIPVGSGQNLTYLPLTNGELAPGEVAVLFLARFGGKLTHCPPGLVPGHYASDAAVHGTGLGDAFHIRTSVPAVAYDIFPFGGGDGAATSATLLIPTSAWRDNYVAVSAYPSSAPLGADPTLGIVAMEDDTSVTLDPRVAIVGGAGIASAPANAPQTHALKKGQFLHYRQTEELTGSAIQATKPIGVWGGASCMALGPGIQACDAAHQQIPPVKALGHEYVAVPHRERFSGVQESPPWRLVGAVDGTTLMYEPAPPPGAPTTLALGQIAEFRATGPFVVKSQAADHPFYMAGYMTGCGEVDPTYQDCRGDPEFVNVVPAAQHLDSYTFFTDPTYPETSLVVVRHATPQGFADVELGCKGVLDGWQPLGSGAFEYTHVDLVRGDFEPQGNCDNGRHEIKSDAPFGLVVWGWGSKVTGGSWDGNLPGFYTQAVSYAYPSGASVEPINDVVVPALR